MFIWKTSFNFSHSFRNTLYIHINLWIYYNWYGFYWIYIYFILILICEFTTIYMNFTKIYICVHIVRVAILIHDCVSVTLYYIILYTIIKPPPVLTRITIDSAMCRTWLSIPNTNHTYNTCAHRNSFSGYYHN